MSQHRENILTDSNSPKKRELNSPHKPSPLKKSALLPDQQSIATQLYAMMQTAMQQSIEELLPTFLPPTLVENEKENAPSFNSPTKPLTKQQSPTAQERSINNPEIAASKLKGMINPFMKSVIEELLPTLLPPTLEATETVNIPKTPKKLLESIMIAEEKSTAPIEDINDDYIDELNKKIDSLIAMSKKSAKIRESKIVHNNDTYNGWDLADFRSPGKKQRKKPEAPIKQEQKQEDEELLWEVSYLDPEEWAVHLATESATAKAEDEILDQLLEDIIEKSTLDVIMTDNIIEQALNQASENLVSNFLSTQRLNDIITYSINMERIQNTARDICYEVIDEYAQEVAQEVTDEEQDALPGTLKSAMESLLFLSKEEQKNFGNLIKQWTASHTIEAAKGHIRHYTQIFFRKEIVQNSNSDNENAERSFKSNNLKTVFKSLLSLSLQEQENFGTHISEWINSHNTEKAKGFNIKYLDLDPKYTFSDNKDVESEDSAENSDAEYEEHETKIQAPKHEYDEDSDEGAQAKKPCYDCSLWSQPQNPNEIHNDTKDTELDSDNVNPIGQTQES